MADALWLNTILPQWYFMTIIAPFGAGVLTAIPASGIVTLVAGVILAIMRRERFVLFALLPVAAAHLYVTVAGFFRGQLPDSSFLFSGLMLVELLFVGALILYARHSKLAAALLGWFCLTYSFFAAFIGAMAFSDTWL